MTGWLNSTGFETPTFTELANPARNLNVNLGGFASVDAQNADSFEIGGRGLIGGRVFEPAQTLNVYGGVSLRVNY